MAFSKGILVEYALALPPLVLAFDFNPSSITRSRAMTFAEGDKKGGYDFTSPLETGRVAQGVSMETESFSLNILLDATDKMQDGHPIASFMGVQPQIDTIRSMMEPKSQLPSGVQVLSSLSSAPEKAFMREVSASVLLFVWGLQVLPVFLTNADITQTDFLPNLAPYRAEADLTLQIIESNNPFYTVESLRQVVGAAINTVDTGVSAIGGLF